MTELQAEGSEVKRKQQSWYLLRLKTDKILKS